MDSWVKEAFEQDIKIAEVVQFFIVILHFRFLAEWAYKIIYAVISYLGGEVFLCTVLAAAVRAFQHGHHLNLGQVNYYDYSTFSVYDMPYFLYDI